MIASCIVRRACPDGKTPCGDPLSVDGGERSNLTSEMIDTLESAGYVVQVKSMGSMCVLPFAEEFLRTFGVASPHASEF